MSKRGPYPESVPLGDLLNEEEWSRYCDFLDERREALLDSKGD